MRFEVCKEQKIIIKKETGKHKGYTPGVGYDIIIGRLVYQTTCKAMEMIDADTRKYTFTVHSVQLWQGV